MICSLYRPGPLQSVAIKALPAWLGPGEKSQCVQCVGTNLIHDFTAVTLSVNLVIFREKRALRARYRPTNFQNNIIWIDSYLTNILSFRQDLLLYYFTMWKPQFLLW